MIAASAGKLKIVDYYILSSLRNMNRYDCDFGASPVQELPFAGVYLMDADS